VSDCDQPRHLDQLRHLHSGQKVLRYTVEWEATVNKLFFGTDSYLQWTYTTY